MTSISTTQKVVTGVALAGSAYYCYKNKKALPIFALIVVLSTAAGYIVGGYADTVMPSKK
jgi:hypothetical protein